MDDRISMDGDAEWMRGWINLVMMQGMRSG